MLWGQQQHSQQRRMKGVGRPLPALLRPSHPTRLSAHTLGPQRSQQVSAASVRMCQGHPQVFAWYVLTPYAVLITHSQVLPDWLAGSHHRASAAATKGWQCVCGCMATQQPRGESGIDIAGPGSTGITGLPPHHHLQGRCALFLVLQAAPLTRWWSQLAHAVRVLLPTLHTHLCWVGWCTCCVGMVQATLVAVAGRWLVQVQSAGFDAAVYSVHAGVSGCGCPVERWCSRARTLAQAADQVQVVHRTLALWQHTDWACAAHDPWGCCKGKDSLGWGTRGHPKAQELCVETSQGFNVPITCEWVSGACHWQEQGYMRCPLTSQPEPAPANVQPAPSGTLSGCRRTSDVHTVSLCEAAAPPSCLWGVCRCLLLRCAWGGARAWHCRGVHSGWQCGAGVPFAGGDLLRPAGACQVTCSLHMCFQQWTVQPVGSPSQTACREGHSVGGGVSMLMHICRTGVATTGRHATTPLAACRSASMGLHCCSGAQTQTSAAEHQLLRGYSRGLHADEVCAGTLQL